MEWEFVDWALYAVVLMGDCVFGHSSYDFYEESELRVYL
jgi:hypothetical protein